MRAEANPTMRLATQRSTRDARACLQRGAATLPKRHAADASGFFGSAGHNNDKGQNLSGTAPHVQSIRVHLGLAHAPPPQKEQWTEQYVPITRDIVYYAVQPR